MPNTLSALPSSTYKVTHDPTATIAGDVGSDISKNPFDELSSELLFGMVNDFLGVVDDATGLDFLDFALALEGLLDGPVGLLSGFLGFLTPGSGTSGGGVFGPILNLIPGLGGGSGTLGGLGSFLNPSAFIGAAAGIFAPILTNVGQFFQHLLPQTPLSNITDATPNLLIEPGFDDPDSINLGAGWAWDSTIGRTTVGCAKTTAASVNRELISATIPVVEGQQLNFAVWSKWSSLVYTGTSPIIMGVITYLAGNRTGSTTLASFTSPAASQAAWVQLTGSYTVPAGVDAVSLQFRVVNTASAGNVWFDDAEATKHTDGLPQTWISGLVSVLDDIHDFANSIVAVISNVIHAIPFAGGPLGDLFDDLTRWFTGTQATALTAVSATTIQAQQSIAQPGYIALDATADATFPIANISGATPLLCSVTSAGAMIGFINPKDNGKKNSIPWLGQNTTGITGFYLNLYELDLVTGVCSLIEASANIIGSVSNTLAWNYHNFSTPIDVMIGHVYAVELVIVGSGTYKIAGTATSWIPANTVSYPHNIGAARTTGLPAAPSTFTPTYFSSEPWFGLGGFLFAGPTTVAYNTTGAHTYTIPDWLKYGDNIDTLVLGGGGGGQASQFSATGQGGNPGTWFVQTLVYGVDIPIGTTTLTVNVGSGGAGGVGAGNVGADGTASTVTGTGLVTLTAAGGKGGAGGTNAVGHGPGNQVLNTVTYPGGADQVTASAPGNAPGGGGGGGAPFSDGAAGAVGAVWLAAYQAGTHP